MFKLIVESGPNAGASFEVQERATVGRLKGTEITLADASVSRQHARLLVQGDRLLVRDLDSANGVFVNGLRVTSGEVRAGDRLRIGKVELQVEGATAAAPVPPPATRPPTDQAPSSGAAPPSGPALDRIATRRPTDSGPSAGGIEVRQKAKALQYSPYARGPKDRGLLSSDLDQRSGVFRFVVIAIVLALAVLLAIFSGRIVDWILPDAGRPPAEEVLDGYGDDAPEDADAASTDR